MTHRSTWKAAERRVARLFQTERAALSGGNGKLTRSDSHHPHLFIEAKLRAGSAVWNLYESTHELAVLEAKLPILAILRKGSPGALLVIHQDDLFDLVKLLRDLPAPDKVRRSRGPQKKAKK